MISVTIVRTTLVANDACHEGLEIFDTIAAMQPETDARRLKRLRIVKWTPLHQLWLSAAYPSYSSSLRGRGIIPWIDLRGANLEGAYLEGAYLRGAYRPTGDLPDGWVRGTDGYLARAS